MKERELIWEYRAKGTSSIQGGPIVVGERVFVVTHPTARLGKPSLLAFELRAGRKVVVWEVENVWGELELRGEVLVAVKVGKGFSLEGEEVAPPMKEEVSSRRTSEERFGSEVEMVKAGVHSVVGFRGWEIAVPARLDDWGVEGEWLVVRSGDEVLGCRGGEVRWRVDGSVAFSRGKWPVRSVAVQGSAVAFHRGKRELVCVELDSGEVRWEVEAPGEYEQRPVFGHGVAYSFGEQRGGSVCGFDVRTGEAVAKFGKGRVERVHVAGEVVACRTHNVARVFGPAEALLPAKAKASKKTKRKKSAKKTTRASKGKPTLSEQLESGAKDVRAAGMDLGDAGVRRLVEGAVAGIESLDLRRNGITAAGVRMLCEASALQGLRSLSLSDNPLGDDGAALLARAFPKLGSLELERCRIGDPGCQALADAVWRLDDLLLIDRNPFGTEGLHALASADSLSEYQREQFHLILEDEGAI